MMDFKTTKILNKRYSRTLYYGSRNLKNLDRLSIAQTDFAIRYFDVHAPFDYLDSDFVNTLSYEGSVRPTAFILALIYLERVRCLNKTYFQTSDPADLLSSSILCAMKYLYDEGDEDFAYNNEWAASCSKSVNHVAEKEYEFLDNIQWNLHVKPSEFEMALQHLEFSLALHQGLTRQFFTYTDLDCIFKLEQVKNHLVQMFRVVCMTIGMAGLIYSSVVFACYFIVNCRHTSSTKSIVMTSCLSIDPTTATTTTDNLFNSSSSNLTTTTNNATPPNTISISSPGRGANSISIKCGDDPSQVSIIFPSHHPEMSNNLVQQAEYRHQPRKALPKSNASSSRWLTLILTKNTDHQDHSCCDYSVHS